VSQKKILLLGSTGSIGTRTLDVVRDFSDAFCICGLSTFGRVDMLKSQIEQFRPRAISVSDVAKQKEARRLAESYGIKITFGENALSELVAISEPDIVVVATVGIAGLKPTLAAIAHGADVALANKEVLVTGGDLVMASARAKGISLRPIDSEHNAVAQCLLGQNPSKVRRIILTASGGPFRHFTQEALQKVTPEQALKHPTWRMGCKITIDSATLMNKGFEVIEGHHLFNMPLEQIDVVIHPQSIIHSFVEYVDGSLIAQLSVADMYLTIQSALMFPERRPNYLAPLELSALSALTFEKPDCERFPCLSYAYEAARAGGTAPVALNAANEVAVRRFLNNEIPFHHIPHIIRKSLDTHKNHQASSLEAIEETDRLTREDAEAL